MTYRTFLPFKILVCFACMCLASSMVWSQVIKGKVIAIKDGDTIEILVENHPIKIRLFGIDCPEKAQDYGTQATKFTSQYCFNKEVFVYPHGKDKYQRILGDVILPSGKSLNKLLVQNGYAWRYKYSKDQELLGLQTNAEKLKLGLWALPQPIAPWAFRKDKKSRR